ncbi:phosphotransferase [Knoellia locipacati]|uniref:macrolide 2'-phosphotransferase n=1 Tax=Knoellia locipacati TaxID=882824 RepID=UPI00384D165D
MERTPTFLAALASAGVPGLDPVSVEALPSVPAQDYDVAFVQDSEHRRWVVRAPRSEAAGARMDLTVTLLQMLARRLPFTIPSPRGFVELKGGGRAMIYPFLPGHNLAFDEMPAGPGPAAELGRAIAALHNTDVRLFDEAGMPTYDTDSYRRRRLTELDRAAESGRVPTALLARWEHALEDVALWRFAPTCIHGDLTGDQVLAVFEDDADASTGRIRGLTGWEDAKVADPADDFASLVDEADPATVETVLEAYAHARVERPDPNLIVRARLAAELGILADLMRADARGDQAAVEGFSSRLRRLDDEVHAEDPSDDYRRGSLTPVALRARATPPPVVAEEDDEGEDDVTFSPTAPTDGHHERRSTDTDVVDLDAHRSAGQHDTEDEQLTGDDEDAPADGDAPADDVREVDVAGDPAPGEAPEEAPSTGSADPHPDTPDTPSEGEAPAAEADDHAPRVVARWHEEDDDEVAWEPRSLRSPSPSDESGTQSSTDADADTDDPVTVVSAQEPPPAVR